MKRTVLAILWAIMLVSGVLAEDSATVTSVLVPWTACGMTQSTVLGIPTLLYLPFCFFNLISPVMSCVVAALGFVPAPTKNVEKN